MEYIIDKTDFEYKNTAVALGKFEGLHKGHQLLFHELIKAKEEGRKSVVFTFDMPPKTLISGIKEKVVYTKEERRYILDKMGMDLLIAYPFRQLRTLSPEAFVKEILIDRLDAKEIVVGEDFGFGYQRAGNVKLLERLAIVYGYKLKVIPKLGFEGSDVSSSRIRQCMIDGNLTLANKLLGDPFMILGEVVHGKKLGRKIGMPTANLIPDPNKYLPSNGVYVAAVQIEGDEKQYYGICNIGVKPTVDQEECRGVEIYIFDFQKDIYGKAAAVQLLKFVRPEMKFDSIETLSKQMHEDADTGRAYVAKYVC